MWCDAMNYPAPWSQADRTQACTLLSALAVAAANSGFSLPVIVVVANGDPNTKYCQNLIVAG